ncbi:MAG: hypothetical protein CME62_08665 [Halobacteriovoraceae bacterium]|nr:hypothetical protein [Halobacteriovoraceae bacterium]|tara:strand:+ start:24528 stop:25193 length:666 start_codon:yes stop_codon:yes gene_type:complete
MQNFETKFIASNYQAGKIKSWLDLNFKKDPEFPGTYINSIYFDTPKLDFLNEKDASDHVKSKFRLRWYEDLVSGEASAQCFLEMKHKIDKERFKKREVLDNHFHDLKLSDPKFYKLFQEFRVFEDKVLEPVFPTYNVKYTRFRYIIPNTDIRLCIDYNIHTERINSALMKKTIKTTYLDQCVFELKGSTTLLSSRLMQLEKFGLKKSAFSKYQRIFLDLLH